MNKKFKIAVFGSAKGKSIEDMKSVAGVIGGEIAKRKGILVTGACPGLPHEAALAADSNGGMVIGFSPAMDLGEHVRDFNFPVEPYILIFTGFRAKGRNIFSTRSSDAAIFISGRSGTLNEFTLMYDESGPEKVIGFLENSGGVVDDFILSYIKSTEKQSKAKIIVDKDPINLVSEIFKTLKVNQK